jgi:acyl-coenzyme A thioesterase PaaI-like protein
MHTGPGVRPATAHLALQVTGAPRHGQTTVVSSFLGFTSGSSARQSLVAATVKCGNVVAGHISAACVLLDLPSDRVRPRWPWLPEGFRLAPEEASALDVSERKALELCERAEAAATAQYPFIEHFWCGVPRSSGGEAHLQVPVARHLGNRIGHVQGGLLLGMAMKVADCAVSAHMRLSNISAYFVSPGTGPALTVISHVTHQGRRMATVRTRIVAANDKLVLEASSQHVAA